MKRSIKETLKDMGKINKKTLKNGSCSMLYTALVIAVVVVINLIVGEIPEKYTQIDLSSQKLYTVSDETIDFLKDLEQDVSIYYIVQNGNEDSVVEKMLTKYEEESEHITVEKKDPVLYPNFTSQYTQEQVAENSLIVVSGEKSRIVDYNQLYEMNYDYYSGSANASGFDGEGQIDSAISYVTSEHLPKVYALEGHGELEINSQLQESLEKANYQTEQLNLLAEEKVPEDTACLLIASPQKDLSQEEADKVIAYLEGGGKAMIFTDYVKEELPNMKRILENYGVTMGNGMVFEGDSQNYIMQMPYYLLPVLESGDITSDLISENRYVLMPAAQAVEKMETYRDSLEITDLLSTSEHGYIKENVENMKTFEKESGDPEGKYALGVAITEEVEEEKQTQLVYFGSSSLIDAATDQQVSGGNTELVMNALGWMCENDAPVIAVDSKGLNMEYLTISEYDAGYWSAITCGVIPGLFLVIGAGIWFKRRKQ